MNNYLTILVSKSLYVLEELGENSSNKTVFSIKVTTHSRIHHSTKYYTFLEIFQMPIVKKTPNFFYKQANLHPISTQYTEHNIYSTKQTKVHHFTVLQIEPSLEITLVSNLSPVEKISTYKIQLARGRYPNMVDYPKLESIINYLQIGN